MAERYRRIFEGGKDLYIQDSPVVIKAHVLLRDNMTGAAVAQLKYQNAADKVIKYVKIRITPYDTLNQPAGAPQTFEYMDVRAIRRATFGSEVPVILSDPSAASYKVCVIGVAFDDGAVWTSEPAEWRPDAGIVSELAYREAKEAFNKAESKKYDSRLYSSAAVSFRLLHGYKDANELEARCEEKVREIKNDAKYEHAKKIINDTYLANAGKYKSAIYNLEKLSGWRDSEQLIAKAKQKIEEANAKEEADRIERQRLDEEEKRRKQRNLIKACVVIIIIAVIAILITVFFSVILPAIKHNKAEKLLAEGNYNEAYSLFTEVGDQQAINESKYNRAVEYYNEGDYVLASALFGKTAGYKDSHEYLKKCENKMAYNQAVKNYESESYEDALLKFLKIDGEAAEDCTEYIEKCRDAIYKSVSDDVKNGLYIRALKKLDNHTYFPKEYKKYEDVSKLKLQAMYGYVKEHYVNFDETTYEYLKTLKSEKYLDSAELFENLYAYRVELVCSNFAKNDYESSTTTIPNEVDYWHVEFKLTGGEPGHSKNFTLYHTTKYPNDTAEKSSWTWDNVHSGDTFGFAYNFGFYSYKTGTFTVQIYNNADDTLMGTFTFKIVK